MSGRKIYMTEEEYKLYKEYIQNFEDATTQEEVFYWHEKAMEIVEHAKARQEMENGKNQLSAAAI